LDSLRTIADVRDAVDAYYKLLTVNPIAGAYYNIGGERVISVREILEYLISISKKPNKISFEVDKSRLRLIDADLQIPNTDKFRNHTGWMPRYSFETTMTDLLNYWREKIRQQGDIFINR
jgi:GDPmannose 4,6-dehydratase